MNEHKNCDINNSIVSPILSSTSSPILSSTSSPISSPISSPTLPSAALPMTSVSQTIVRVAVPSPLRQYFDYLLPKHYDGVALRFGMRVLVPFGQKREVVGFVLEVVGQSQHQLKRITQVIDREPLWSPALLELLRWMSSYYHYPIGEVLSQVLPPVLRKLPKKSKAIPPVIPAVVAATTAVSPSFALNAQQQHAIGTILSARAFQTFLVDGITGSGKTEVYLCVIASLLAQGKQALVLVPEINLTPQTVARFTKRFPKTPIAIIHSKLTPKERLHAWQDARSGVARIVIGTRSALFTPLAYPGVIIIDEEHDQSFKQQSLLRYSARDTAIMRGKLENIPVVLGSATPSLESFANATGAATALRYTHITLPERAGSAQHPQFHIIDMRTQKIVDGLAKGLIQAMEQHLDNQGQILLFLNSRGYAPILLCSSCGWTADCKNCDAHTTLHRKTQKLHCHHCGAIYAIPQTCTQCGKQSLYALGLGTEKLEAILPRLFPGVTCVRVDSDTTSGKGAMNKMLESIHSGASQILIGTQMLAKGHHFPNVTLATVLNVDNGLFSADFRASEHLAQLIMQVAGRAGRAERAGEVYIQTYHPQHPLLQRLVQRGYHSFARACLSERHDARLPPFSYLALLRVEAKNQDYANVFLADVKREGMRLLEQLLETRTNAPRDNSPNSPNSPNSVNSPNAANSSIMNLSMTNSSGVNASTVNSPTANSLRQIQILGPTASPMERKAGLYQVQLLLQGSNRMALQNFLAKLVRYIDALKIARNLKWSLDVDPVDMM